MHVFDNNIILIQIEWEDKQHYKAVVFFVHDIYEQVLFLFAESNDITQWVSEINAFSSQYNADTWVISGTSNTLKR